MLRFFAGIVLALCVSAPLRAEIQLTVEYSESADLYSLMDNVSGWLEGFTNPLYREEWEERFGWSTDDQEWADRYAEYRRRTFSDPTQGLGPATSPHGIFASRETNAAGSDPLADYMVAGSEIAASLSGLETIASQEDAQMLRGFYRHFRPKWEVLLAESAPLRGYARELDERLDRSATVPFIERVTRFFQSETQGEFRVLFTRFPPGAYSSAEVLGGKNLLLHSPVALPFDKGDWATIVLHEFVHYISSKQPDELKRGLTDRFLMRCKFPHGLQPNWLIEEPLAVAIGQAAYSQFVLGKPLERLSNWYAVPWVDLSARTLERSVIQALDSDATLEDTAIVEEAADRCRDLTAIIDLENAQTG